MLRPGFAKLCDHWHSLQRTTDVLHDIYDGNIWKDFQYINGSPALADQFVYAIMVNVDWFQSFKLTQTSVGAMYLTILNLPYHCRFKCENTILLWIIPGPSEPSEDINQYLNPFVKELHELFIGVPMNINGMTEPQTVRCLLLDVACDMPASRKVCGFLSHSAILGFTKCYKEFPGRVGEKDYSGFNRDDWILRTDTKHRLHISEIQNATTLTTRDVLEAKYGCRYSILLELPYFDPIRMVVIDPMHNLFLGTTKHILKDIWMASVVTQSDLCSIQGARDNMQVPLDIGRIPRKIETGFSGCTADQYKNWVTLYSIPCLHSVLDRNQLENWRHFVLACRILCKRHLSHSEVTVADTLLMRFCRRTQELYGTRAITPNMLMHSHLKSVILDFGPVYAFWLFSYERFNGILGNQPSNNRSIEVQLMRRFNRDNASYGIYPPEEFRNDFSAELNSLKPRITGSLLASQNSGCHELHDFELPKTSTCHVFSSDDVTKLTQLLVKLLSLTNEEDLFVNAAFRQYKCITLKNIMYLSTSKRKSSIALASWDEELFGPPPSSGTAVINPEDITLRPIRIEHFVMISYSLNKTHCLAIVSWFEAHPQRFEIGKPAQVWCKQLFECHGLHSFLPVNKLSCRCVYLHTQLHDDNVLVVVPLIE